MRTVLILILCAAGVAGGVYFAWAYGTEKREEEELTKRLQETENELSRLRNEFKAFKEVTRNEYEQRLMELNEEVAKLNDEVKRLKERLSKAEAGLNTGEKAVMRPPPPDGDGDKKKKEPKGADRMVRRFLERGKQMNEMRIKRFQKRAEQLGWDATKTEQVVAILNEESEQIRQLFQSCGDTSPEQIDREELMRQIKQIRAMTITALREVLTEDEIRQIAEIIIPRRKGAKPPLGRDGRRRPPE